MTTCFVGIDAGATLHHIAVVDSRGEILPNGLPQTGCTTTEIVRLCGELPQPPSVIAIDAPCALAEAGSSRPAEHDMQRTLGCRIFFTPDEQGLRGHWWESFVRTGLELHRSVRERMSCRVIEVFPTGSRTVWAGPRSRGETKAAWSEHVLRRQAQLLGVAHSLPDRWNQHQRDALTAAWTAMSCGMGAARELTGGSSQPGIWVPHTPTA